MKGSSDSSETAIILSDVQSSSLFKRPLYQEQLQLGWARKYVGPGGAAHRSLTPSLALDTHDAVSPPHVHQVRSDRLER